MLTNFRSRLVLSNLLITLLGLLVTVIVFTQLLVQRSTEVRKSDRAQQAQRLASQIERQIYGRHASGPALAQEVDTASAVLGVRIIVVSPAGIPRIDSAVRTPYYRGSWNHQIDESALASGRSAIHSLQSPNLDLFQSPIHGTFGHPNGGAVLLVVRVADVQPSAATITGLLLTALGAALAVWVLIAIFFTSSISRPLLRITNATVRMARGNYSVRVPVKGPGEIARLASSFNSMAQQVQETNQLLKDFVGNASHDLRTPLTMITGFSQALLDGTAGPEEMETSAGIIHDEALKMQRLVEDLLQLTRLESGLVELRRRPTDLKTLVQGAIDRLRLAHSDRALPAVRNEIAASTPQVEVDPAQIERVMSNLLNNALDHTPPEGWVTVGAQQVGDGWVELSVADTGCGIEQEDVPRIFERFYRADKSRERGGGHSGLGLAIVRETVEAHGGRIEVESAPGRGAIFRFTLPKSRSRGEEPEARHGDEPVRRAAAQ